MENINRTETYMLYIFSSFKVVDKREEKELIDLGNSVTKATLKYKPVHYLQG